MMPRSSCTSIIRVMGAPGAIPGSNLTPARAGQRRHRQGGGQGARRHRATAKWQASRVARLQIRARRRGWSHHSPQARVQRGAKDPRRGGMRQMWATATAAARPARPVAEFPLLARGRTMARRLSARRKRWSRHCTVLAAGCRDYSLSEHVRSVKHALLLDELDFLQRTTQPT
jgi:hypothetical protein